MGKDTLLVLTREDGAIWLWRTIVGLVVVAATFIVMQQDKHLRQPPPRPSASTRCSDADANSCTDDSLGDWVRAQEEAWVQPSPPQSPAGAAKAAEEGAQPPRLAPD